ncbi:MAG: phage baseplate protein [Chelatococcus sp.]|nr:MAG: phage baseplate protein [Chelatococcus sp.]
MTGIVDRAQIPFAHWQMALSPAGTDDGLGQIVTGLDDLHQSINTIVLTEQGTVPLQPLKCTRLLPYIDKPPAIAIPNLTREIWDAITAWEPRVVVQRVAPIAAGFSHWRFPVFWYPRADIAREIRMTEVRYG